MLRVPRFQLLCLLRPAVVWACVTVGDQDQLSVYTMGIPILVYFYWMCSWHWWVQDPLKMQQHPFCYSTHTWYFSFSLQVRCNSFFFFFSCLQRQIKLPEKYLNQQFICILLSECQFNLKLHKQQQELGLELRFLNFVLYRVMFTFSGKGFLSFLDSFFLFLYRAINSTGGMRKHFLFLRIDFSMAVGTLKVMNMCVNSPKLGTK